MKKLIIIFLFFTFNQCIQSQECKLKKEIVIDVLSDKSLKNFFKNKEDIVVVNSNCKNLNFNLSQFNVLFIEKSEKFSIKFINYTKINNTIDVTLNYNSKNILHILKYKIVNNKLISLSREIIFHKTAKKK